jgi:sterol desaturase/sphingolipid hydroxylase (fatty acid hydroxylase superfamily)
MNILFLASLLAQYHWLLAVYAGVGIIAATLLGGQLARLVPGFRAAGQLNKETFRKKMERPAYKANQMWNRKWSVLYLVVIFGLILPFCLTRAAQPWWRMPLDIAVILMVYDFFYYFTHRFLFHDNGVFGAPLLWMHAVHHRQHNPCRWDASYIHPLEIAIGLGLYVATIFILSRFMGGFSVATIIITWVAFTEINLHNHDLWDAERFPGRYLNTMSQMHHNHHATFTGGNYATISLLYDWMFGTLDYGNKRKGGDEGFKPVMAHPSGDRG